MKRRNRVLRAVGAVVLLGAAFAAGALFFERRGAPTEQASGERRILYYRSPMNPQITSPTPKKDPMGMDFVPVYEDEVGAKGAPGAPPDGVGPNAVRIDPRVIQQTGVTTEKAERRLLSRTIRTVGIVRPDERRLYNVTVKFDGWVERLYVNFTGDRVRRGDSLATVYSPELLATQREYLLALRYARSLGQEASEETRAEAEKLVESARRRLLLWDISDRQIKDLARRGKPTRAMTIHAPADGVVLEKEITAGSQVQPGMTLLRIADLEEVWVFAQIYPYQLPWLREGQRADIEVPGIPGQTLEGQVNYIQPVVSPEARSVEVRIQVAQPGEAILLKPNMYANVEIRSPEPEEAMAIREQAIIRTGERNVAIVALGNGYFEARELKLGATGDGYVQVLEGLNAGEEVVTSSQFLLDSESSLRAALNAMGKGTSIGDGGQPEPGQEEKAPAPPLETPAPESDHSGHGMP